MSAPKLSLCGAVWLASALLMCAVLAALVWLI